MRNRRRDAGLDIRAWAVWTAPRPFLALWWLVVLAAVGLSTGAWVVLHESHHILVRAGLVVVVALACEETMTWASRLRLRLDGDVQQDMLGVWGIAVALALPAALACLVVALQCLYSWVRHSRPAGQLPHRVAFNAAVALLACLAAGRVFAATSDGGSLSEWSAHALFPVPLAIVVYVAVNRGLVAVGLAALGRSPRGAVFTRDENLLELATLCLGVLAALAIIHEPLLIVFVLPPMITIQRAAAITELEAAATTDAKTGLLNAVAWERVAVREVARSRREGTSVGVLVVDIDHFKSVNDRFGHLAGDNVLRQVGRLLSSGVREYDTVARFGGEEFVAILPDADAAAAVAVAERLRSRINGLWLSQAIEGVAPDLDAPMAVSIGVSAAGPQDDAELHQLLSEADGALYRAKDAGRNRVVLAEGAGGDSSALDVAG